jgi:hypothetical protein
MINKLINLFTINPKKLFIVDALGAFVTACSLLIFIQQFNQYVGLPKTALTFLSSIAISYCACSTACCLFLKNRWTIFLIVIGIANLLYCIVTLGILIKYYQVTTIIGALYFWGEVVIICTLSYVEITVARRIKKLKK